MEIFTRKNLILKIVIAVVVVILFNFCAPTISQAASIGGTLLSPIVDLLVAIGDGVMYLIQNIVMGLDNSLVKLSTTGRRCIADFSGNNRRRSSTNRFCDTYWRT